jgi:hypothetical protein
MAKIWTTVSCKPREVTRIIASGNRWLGLRCNGVSAIDFPQGETRETDLREIIVEPRRIVPRSTTFSP